MPVGGPHHPNFPAGPPGDDDEFSDDDDAANVQNQYITSQQSTAENAMTWDVFRHLPPSNHSLSEDSDKYMHVTVKILKVFTYLLTFCIVLMCGVISKGIVLLMASQLKAGKTLPICPNSYKSTLQPENDYMATLPVSENVAWAWMIFFVYLIPEAGSWFRSTRMCIFKKWTRAPFVDLTIVIVFEMLHTIGTGLLIYAVLPDLDVIKGAMLTNCVCFIPGLFGMLSRDKKESSLFGKIVVDILALFAQLSGFIVWPILEMQRENASMTQVWTIPFAVFLTSFGWWENYVDVKSKISFVRFLGGIKQRLWKTRYFTYMFVSLIKILTFFGMMILTMGIRLDNDFAAMFDLSTAFSSHLINVTKTRQVLSGDLLPDVAINDVTLLDEMQKIPSDSSTPVYVFLILTLTAYVCYIFGKFACKIYIQGFSFAFPVNLTIPVSISLLITACGLRTEDVCAFNDIMPAYLFWECKNGDILTDFLKNDYAWIWLLWLLSQTWITLHIWTPKCERLASTEKLFVHPMYHALFIDQSLALNRRRDDDPEVKADDVATLQDEQDQDHYERISVDNDSSNTETSKSTRSTDHITRIYTCATMWHENREEMIEMLKSIMRMDEDQSARRITLKYLNIVDNDYYEFETHIFFDDAFEVSDDGEEHVVNGFVKLLVELIDESAKHVHQTQIRIRPPKKLPAPYGGRLVWTLPGKTKIVAHLKDKDKIRHKKRWSQVMYMYYLLGFKLMDQQISVDRKEIIAENTFLLTLDGDIDFTPKAVALLVDLMKKNTNLGAACGRIHPVGSGLMVWYQMFEYAIGHWLQKATEHMIGCVLCSPGCFSLFRGRALMDDNVMAKYTTTSNQARHYVQYDQGEDRWLCTLLLQRGYRVEYSAASDAYTHAPEGFSEFYNQRRRWVPSTMANIMDLLGDYKRTIKINDNISLPYIAYQTMLMGGTILGPGTIFLMLVGAFVAAFNISNWRSFEYNIIPILGFMIICFLCNSSTQKYQKQIQIFLAQMLSAGYALTMMAVIVGTTLQLSQDGVGSPSAIFLIALSGSFFISACMHPQEFKCIIPGLLYLLCIPSMYLLLIIYSLINLNDVSWGTREVATKKTKKITVAMILSVFYALVMCLVAVALALQVAEEGWTTPSSIFLFATAASFVLTAMLHPLEFWCLPCGFVYYLVVPSMYLLLQIYSLFNMNNVSWGTRDVPVKLTKQEQLAEQKRMEEEAAKKKKGGFMGMLSGSQRNEDEGSIEFSLAGLFKIMCCVHPKPNEFAHMEESLKNLKASLDRIERHIDGGPAGPGNRRRSTMQPRVSIRSGDSSNIAAELEDEMESVGDSSEGSAVKEERDDLVNPFWMDDEVSLRRGEIDFLPQNEIQFFKDLIERYLFPINSNKEQKAKNEAELKDLRNIAVFSFTMMNAIFVIIVFLLQLNKDMIHVNWPLGVKSNITYDPETREIHITKEYLQLEPIGLVFVFFFALILIIQFTAMLFHRFGTISHILASTELTCGSANAENTNDKAMIDKRALEVVRNMQKLRGFDNDSENAGNVGRRKTIANIARGQKKQNIGTLDVAFKKRFLSISKENQEDTDLRRLSARRETIKHIVDHPGWNDKKAANRMQTLNARKPHDRTAIATEMDNERVFTPLNGSIAGSVAAIETNVDYVTEGKYGVARGGKESKYGTVGNKTGSINGGYMPSDNEMVYGYAPPASLRGSNRFTGVPPRGGAMGSRQGSYRPPSSLKRDVDM